jgi:hypothetical protein
MLTACVGGGDLTGDSPIYADGQPGSGYGGGGEALSVSGDSNEDASESEPIPDTDPSESPSDAQTSARGLLATVSAEGIQVSHFGIPVDCGQSEIWPEVSVSMFIIEADYGVDGEGECSIDAEYVIDPRGMELDGGIYLLRALNDQISLDLTELLE